MHTMNISYTTSMDTSYSKEIEISLNDDEYRELKNKIALAMPDGCEMSFYDLPESVVNRTLSEIYDEEERFIFGGYSSKEKPELSIYFDFPERWKLCSLCDAPYGIYPDTDEDSGMCEYCR